LAPQAALFRLDWERGYFSHTRRQRPDDLEIALMDHESLFSTMAREHELRWALVGPDEPGLPLQLTSDPFVNIDAVQACDG
jgi:hypothetical protein